MTAISNNLNVWCNNHFNSSGVLMDCWSKHLPEESNKLILPYTWKPNCHRSNFINKWWKDDKRVGTYIIDTNYSLCIICLVKIWHPPQFISHVSQGSVMPSDSLAHVFFSHWFASLLTLQITKLGLYVIIHCDERHHVFLISVTVCLLLSFHFSYLINKTVFALIDELLTLCHHVTHNSIHWNVRGFV